MFKMNILQIDSNMHPFCNIFGEICLILCLIRCLGFSILLGFRHEMRQITLEMLQNVRNACYYRFAIYQERNGVHFEHLWH
jgi:hypothetical protein